jgi:hypothetical protein
MVHSKRGSLQSNTNLGCYTSIEERHRKQSPNKGITHLFDHQYHVLDGYIELFLIFIFSIDSVYGNELGRTSSALAGTTHYSASPISKTN